MSVSEELAERVCDALEYLGWRADVVKEDDGIYVELERYTDLTGYDFVTTIDLRNKDAGEPFAWEAAAREAIDAFDPEQEALLWAGGRGAPSLTEMLEDFRELERELLAVEQAVSCAVRGERLEEKAYLVDVEYTETYRATVEVRGAGDAEAAKARLQEMLAKDPGLNDQITSRGELDTSYGLRVSGISSPGRVAVDMEVDARRPAREAGECR